MAFVRLGIGGRYAAVIFSIIFDSRVDLLAEIKVSLLSELVTTTPICASPDPAKKVTIFW